MLKGLTRIILAGQDQENILLIFRSKERCKSKSNNKNPVKLLKLWKKKEDILASLIFESAIYSVFNFLNV